MAKKELATTNKQSAYKVLAESFLKKSFPKKTFDDMAKSNFLRICMINGLDPFKKEIYPLPFTDANGITTISAVIDYHVFLDRAEQSGKLNWRGMVHKKEWGKIISSKITIYRNDRKEPFVYEADFEDLKTVNTKKTTLRDTKPEMMARKQMIRIWFSLAFPESCSKLNPEEDDRDPEMAEIIDGEEVWVVDTEAKPGAESEPEEFNDTRTDEEMDDPDMPPPTFLGDDDKREVSEDQKRIIDELLKDIPEFEVRKFNTYKEADEVIFDIKTAIFDKIMKNKKPCTDDYLNMVFGNSDDVRIQGMHSNLKKSFKAWDSLN